MNNSQINLERNPITQNKHRKQVFWQITFPLILGFIAILALGVWAIVAAVQGNGTGVSQGADASLIFLLMPVMVMALLPLILFAGLAYGFFWLNKNLPSTMNQIQQAMIKVRDGVRTGSDKLAEPIIRISSTAASLQGLKRKSRE